MTLRVKIEIVPYGVEENAREIYRFDIFNKGRADKMTKYGVIELDQEKKTGGLWTNDVWHRREKGALELIRHVLERLKFQ